MVAVLTRAPAPVGRKRVLTPSPVHQWATERGIEVHTPDKLTGDLAELLKVDTVAVVAYGLLVPQELLDVPTHGWLNLHYSLLPAYRGAAPVQAAIAAGEQTTGVSIFRIEQGLDTGPVFASRDTAIGARETAGELLERLSEEGAELFAETLEKIAFGLEPTEQTGEPSYAPRVTSADARLDLTRPAAELDRIIRAYTPAPGAWATWDDQRVKIGPAEITAEAPPPGHVDTSSKRPVLGTGEGGLVLDRIAPPGKGWMNAEDWARGVRSEIVWN